MSVFNEIRLALSGKSQVSVQVLLKVNYCFKYSYALFPCNLCVCCLSLVIVFYLLFC